MWCLKSPRSVCFIHVSSDQVSRGFRSEFRFSEAASGGNAVANPFDASIGGADDDDLYNYMRMGLIVPFCFHHSGFCQNPGTPRSMHYHMEIFKKVDVIDSDNWVRREGQDTQEELEKRDLKAELEEHERKHFSSKENSFGKD
ncbi:hypothetical protein Tco_1190778 [Tanacetum coccineum]